MDLRLGLKPGRDRPEAFGTGSQPLPDSTGPQRYALGENAYLKALQATDSGGHIPDPGNQLILFDFYQDTSVGT
jgi:hypothetical protein